MSNAKLIFNRINKMWVISCHQGAFNWIKLKQKEQWIEIAMPAGTGSNGHDKEPRIW